MSEASPGGRSIQRVGALMRRATYASVVVAGLLVVVKLIAWVETNSVSLLSSFIDSLLDGSASLANLVAVRQALVPPDREHRFGHGKAEPLASLGQATFIAGSAVLLLIEAIKHLIHPQPITNTKAGLAVMVFAVAVTLVLVLYQRTVVKRTGSLVVSVDAFHYRADLVLNVAVIAALVLTAEFGYVLIDPIFGGVIALWIIWGAWQVANRAIVQLMDRELPDAERERIRAIVLAHPEVHAVHDMKTRAAGPISFIQIHLEMDADLPLIQAHRIADEVEASITAAYPRAEVIIHQDPVGVAESRGAYSR